MAVVFNRRNQVSKTIPRLVPWIDWTEWMMVKNGLYSARMDGDMASTENALEVVSLWRLRGRLPHACESSAQLVEIIIKDNQSRSENELKMLYSIAILRGINGLVDPSQQSLYNDSVHSIATKIGLPTWLVELRHDATHQLLPSLNILREGSKQLLQWYYDNYWQVQMEFLAQLTNNCLDNNEMNESQIDNMLLANPSMLSEIFIPIFLDNTVFSPIDADTSELSKNKLKKDFAQQYSTWGTKIKQIITSHHTDSAFEVLFLKLYIAFWSVLSSSESTNSYCIQWKLNCINYWLQRISSLNSNNCVISSIGVIYACAIQHNVASYILTHKSYIELSVLDLTSTINIYVNNCIGPKSIEKVNHNKKRKLSHWRVIEADEGLAWPLGMIPGNTQYPNLHQVYYKSKLI